MFASLILTIVGMSLAVEAHAQTYGRREQTDPSIVYEGNWQTIANPAVSGGTLAASNQPGASATLTFTGSGATWMGYKCPCAGIVRIYLDGVEQTTRDMYDPAHIPQQAGFTTYGLENTQHTLRIVVSGERNSASTGTYVGIDAFDVGPPDSLEPNVSITAPPSGSVVSGMVTISADAVDNLGVTGVSFYADDYFLGTDRAAPYSVTVDSSRAPHGSLHALRAVAHDAFNSSAPDFAHVTVDSGGAADVYPPAATMTAPANDSVVRGIVTISADASDNVGITRVVFLANGMVIGEDNTAPYSITRNTSGIPNGSQYQLSASAYDAAGNVSNGAGAVNVTVQN